MYTPLSDLYTTINIIISMLSDRPSVIISQLEIDGLEQDCSNSCASALELM